MGRYSNLFPRIYWCSIMSDISQESNAYLLNGCLWFSNMPLRDVENILYSLFKILSKE